ncbi:MAG: hypothetical protein GF398_03710 [Chitinivibrionales bacterium]|nr:hypothetical protein [Chitinivibrionales bacterium]
MKSKWDTIMIFYTEFRMHFFLSLILVCFSLALAEDLLKSGKTTISNSIVLETTLDVRFDSFNADTITLCEILKKSTKNVYECNNPISIGIYCAVMAGYKILLLNKGLHENEMIISSVDSIKMKIKSQNKKNAKIADVYLNGKLLGKTNVRKLKEEFTRIRDKYLAIWII